MSIRRTHVLTAALVVAVFGGGAALGFAVGRGGARDRVPTPRAPVKPVEVARGGACPCPCAPTPPATAEADPTPGRMYWLGRDETLRDVAQRAYGTPRRAAEIVQANPGLDPARVSEGTLLYIPPGTKPRPEVAASRPSRTPR